MSFLSAHSAFFKIFVTILFSLSLFACGGGAGQEPVSSPPPPSNEITKVPLNLMSQAYVRDLDGNAEKLAGTIVVKAPAVIDNANDRSESVWVYWANEQGGKLGDAWLKTKTNTIYTIIIPEGTNIPADVHQLLLYPSNKVGQALQGKLISFHDFVGNAALSGPGGNEIENWYYGDDRATIPIQRIDQQNGTCIFDNGLVSVINMNNTRDDHWDTSSSNGLPNEVNDNAFPAYQFLCDENPINNSDDVSDEFGVWTYSTLNDAMFYGTIVYDTFLKYLGEPPFEDKIRLRVHYGSLSETSVYWDGAYANFSDGFLSYYSMASLDVIGHEVGHGVLNRISNLNSFEQEISTDAQTLHEAFSDIAGIMVKYEFTGHTNNWIHGEEAKGWVRKLDQIQTESGAIKSFLDYDAAGDNFYRRIGMITYPFYLLSQQWGIEPVYKVYLGAAKTCWVATTTLTQAADCIKQQAALMELPEADVVAAFKAVKIKLFDDGVLSYFTAEQYKLRTKFIDRSQSTNQVTQWLWDFGDGQTSTEASPEHTYAEAGDYQVKLTVTDQSNDQDNFTLPFSLTNEYCPIRDTFAAENLINTVVIDGTDINFSQTQWDYTQDIITLTDPSNVLINILGDTQATAKTTRWRIWIDLNNNGNFDDESEELVVDTDIAQGQSYGINTTLDLSTLLISAFDNGEPKYMRIYGDSSSFPSCYAGLGEAFDVRVVW
ncbi:MAG: hypothetical protein ACJAVV_000051 [Alphaproteobacteria bacterium]|jgi:hypothetical protein